MNKDVFSQEFQTPHHSAPFSLIQEGDYEPAIISGIEKARAEIDAICDSSEKPTFENTVVALERVGAELSRVLNIFYPLQSALATDYLMDLSVRISPVLSDYSTSVTLDPRLWKRIKKVYDKRGELNLDAEDTMLLEQTYESFAFAGALLEGDAREEFKKITSQLTELTTRFGQNVLKEMNATELYVDDEDMLAGIPRRVIEEAHKLAKDRGHSDGWIFTMAQPTYVAVMKSAHSRDLREKMWKLYNRRNTAGEFSNIDIIRSISELRLRKARLLGFNTFADFKLRRTMAGTPARVYDMLHSLASAYRPVEEKEMAELRQYSGLEDFVPWDYSYYANRLRNERFSYDEEALRPYFSLPDMVKGVFGLAGSLYGISFREAEGIEVYHPDVKAYEVTDSDGSYLGLLYTDFFPRESKRPGAWMTDFRPQWSDEKGEHRPHVTIVMNFTKPTADAPSLLSPDEVRTFLHEFGHALHGLFARTRYASLSGTNVYRDFVELPSQFNENFLTRREFLDTFARHYLTGEPIPDSEIAKLEADARFGAGYACLRQLGFGFLDMAWHTIAAPVEDVVSFERKACREVEIFPPQESALISPQFSHIFSGGYAAGYYSYKWAELLDADAFEMFREHGVIDRDTAVRFRREVLEKGGTEDPDLLYRRFRGKAPDPAALLRRDGVEKC